MNSDLTIDYLLCNFLICSSLMDLLNSARPRHGGKAIQTSKHFFCVMDMLSGREWVVV